MSTVETSMGTDTAETMGRAIDEFGRRLRAVRKNQWTGGTPCTEWDVRALVNHVVGELRWIPPMLEGRTIAEVGDRFAGDLLGADPRHAWTDASRQALEAAGQPGAVERTVHLSYGDSKAEDYLSELTADIVIHTWDMARAIGTDERLDPQLLAFAADILEPRAETWRAAGAFAAAVEVPAGSDAQTKLLALVGRNAG